MSHHTVELNGASIATAPAGTPKVAGGGMRVVLGTARDGPNTPSEGLLKGGAVFGTCTRVNDFFLLQWPNNLEDLCPLPI